MKKIFLFMLSLSLAALAAADVTGTAQALPSVLTPELMSSLASAGLSTAGLGFAGPILSGLLDTFMDLIPDRLKPWIPVLCGLFVGMTNAHATGQGFAAGIVPGLVMAGMAAKHHDKRTDKPVVVASPDAVVGAVR